MTKTRVAHVITRLCHGGASNVLATLGRHFERDQFELSLVYGSLGQQETDASDEVLPHFDQSFHVKSLQRELRPFQDLTAFFQLKNLFRQLQPNLVHTHTSKAGMLGRLAATSLGIPVVHSTHGHIFGRKATIPGVGGMTRPLFLTLEKWIARKTDQIFTLSASEIDDLLSFGVVSKKPLAVLSSPVELEKLRHSRSQRNQLRESRGLSSEDRIIVHVGRLAAEKGHGDLIEALSKGVVGQLWLAGEGPLRSSLEALVAKKNLQARVKFLGHCLDLHEWLSLADVLVLPSTYEGQGLVLVEAMAAGVPVVASKVGGIPEVIEDEVTGLLVPPRDPQALSEALLRLEQDRDLALKLVANADQVVSRFEPKTTIDILKKTYQQLTTSSWR